MMNTRTIRTLSLITAAWASAGLVPPALGQEYILRIEGGPDQVDTSGGSVTITLDVIGDIFESTGPEFMLWGSFALETSGSAIIEQITWSHADWSENNFDGGYTNDGNYAQIEFGQWQGIGWTPRDGSAIGNRIGSFQITIAGASAGDFQANLIHGERFSLSTVNIETGGSYYSTPDSLELLGYSTAVVPAPGSVAILLGSGIFGIRRKR